MYKNHVKSILLIHNMDVFLCNGYRDRFKRNNIKHNFNYIFLICFVRNVEPSAPNNHSKNKEHEKFTWFGNMSTSTRVRENNCITNHYYSTTFEQKKNSLLRIQIHPVLSHTFERKNLSITYTLKFLTLLTIL